MQLEVSVQSLCMHDNHIQTIVPFTVHCLPEEGGLSSLMEKERWKKLKQTVIKVMCQEAQAKKKNL